MDFEQRLRASLVAPKPGPMFTAKVLARIARAAKRRRSRVILFSTVLVVAAAASMLAWYLPDGQSSPVEVAAMSVVPSLAPAVEEPVVQSMPEAGAPEKVSTVQPQEGEALFSVVVMPLRQEVQGANRRAPAQALYAATLDELRKVPGLALLAPGASGDDDSAFVLTITSLDTTVVPSGGVLVRSADGSTSCIRTNGPERACGVNMLDGQKPVADIKRPDPVSYDDHVFVEMRLQRPHSHGAASGDTFSLLADGAATPQLCSRGNEITVCMTPAQVAASKVKTMRLQRFPQDAAFIQSALAKQGDANPQAPGEVTLQDLLASMIGVGGTHSRLDAETVRALSVNLAGQPANTRANAWITLTHATHPALVAPLVESLRHDTDRQVRLAALANLAANYSTDPVVRGAFEEIGRADPDLIVRATARRNLYGPEQWRTDTLAALNNTGLSYEARLAPLLVNMTGLPMTVSRPQDVQVSGIRQDLLKEQPVLAPLMALVREHSRDADHAQANGDALGLLVDVDDPAVFDLFLQMSRESMLPSQVSTQVRRWANNHRDDPRVPQKLPIIEASPEMLERMKRYVEETGQLPPSMISNPAR